MHRGDRQRALALRAIVLRNVDAPERERAIASLSQCSDGACFLLRGIPHLTIYPRGLPAVVGRHPLHGKGFATERVGQEMRIGKINGIFAPVSLGAPPGTPPPERSIASGSRYLRLQVDSLTWSGTTSHSGCGVYSLACLPLAEVFSLLLYICTV